MNIEQLPTWFPVAIILYSLWVLPWEGVALWKAARNKDLVWFIILFLTNTLGILEILYIFIFGKKKEVKSE